MYVYISWLLLLCNYNRLTLFSVLQSSCVQVSSDRLLPDTPSLVSLRQRCSSCSTAASVTWWHLLTSKDNSQGQCSERASMHISVISVSSGSQSVCRCGQACMSSISEVSVTPTQKSQLSTCSRGLVQQSDKICSTVQQSMSTTISVSLCQYCVSRDI